MLAVYGIGRVLPLLSQLAMDGTKRPQDCKFTVTVSSITILDAVEIIPCTDKAIKSIEEVDEWKY